MSKRHELILNDLRMVFDCGIDEFIILAGACKGLLNAWGYKQTPGWDKSETVIGFPDPDFKEEDQLELGEYINHGIGEMWDKKVLYYLEYLEKINK